MSEFSGVLDGSEGLEGIEVLEGLEEWMLPDTITLRAICREGDEWSPIVTVRLAVDSPDAVSRPHEEKPKMEGLFDLQGRRVTARELRQGIFVVNGKKRVVR